MPILFRSNGNSLSATLWEMAERKRKSFQQIYKYFEYGKSMWYASAHLQPKPFQEQTQTIKQKRYPVNIDEITLDSPFPKMKY